jgi:proteic killer suppression protein
MIISFRHKGLQHLYEDKKGKHKGLVEVHIERLKDILLMIDSAKRLSDMQAPGLRLHQLKYDLKGLWAIDVDERWRIEFDWKDGDIYDVDYENYHKSA